MLTTAPAPAPSSPLAGRVVVSIEDDAVFRRYVELALTPELVVRTAATAREGVRMLALRCPDLVLLDINLPDVSGHSLLRWMREQEHLRDVPVFMLTGHTDTGHAARSLADGAHGLITKPIAEDELRRVVHTALRGEGVPRAAELAHSA